MVIACLTLPPTRILREFERRAVGGNHAFRFLNQRIRHFLIVIRSTRYNVATPRSGDGQVMPRQLRTAHIDLGLGVIGFIPFFERGFFSFFGFQLFVQPAIEKLNGMTAGQKVRQTARLGDGRAITVQLQQVLDRFVTTEPGRSIRLIHMGDIPGDPSVRQAIMRRQLLIQNAPGCPAALAITQLAQKIQEVVVPR